jgi:hypothetical protein
MNERNEKRTENFEWGVSKEEMNRNSYAQTGGIWGMGHSRKKSECAQLERNHIWEEKFPQSRGWPNREGRRYILWYRNSLTPFLLPFHEIIKFHHQLATELVQWQVLWQFCITGSALWGFLLKLADYHDMPNLNSLKRWGEIQHRIYRELQECVESSV